MRAAFDGQDRLTAGRYQAGEQTETLDDKWQSEFGMLTA